MEALSNVRKHANAKEVEVLIKFDSDEISASVSDNGEGFDMNSALINEFTINSMGLVTMKERVEMLGGSFNIKSKCGSGTRVAFSIPNNGNGITNQSKKIAISSGTQGGKYNE